MGKKKIVVSKPVQTELFVDSLDEPIVLRDEMEALGLLAPHIKAKALVGETFMIFKAKTFKGQGDPEFDPYFCHCTDLKKKEVWTTVLGGWAVTPLLAGYIALDLGKPIVVTLGFQEGGEHDGYYTLE